MPPVGLLGGTFDPVHLGHIQVAKDVATQLSLTDMRLMPNPIPAHRPQPLLDAEHRLQALRLAVQTEPSLSLEISEWRAGEAGEFGYTVDSLLRLKAELPNTPLVFVMGMDAYQQITTWKDYQRLPDLCHLVVMTRAGVEPKLSGVAAQWLSDRKPVKQCDLSTSLSGSVRLCEVTPMPISATQVRTALKNAEPLQDLLPAAIIPLIQTLDPH